jgi:hypothetical protein
MKLMTMKQTAEQHPAFTVPSLRWHLQQRNASGLSKATVKVGRRIYIDSDAFNEWLETQREAN